MSSRLTPAQARALAAIEAHGYVSTLGEKGKTRAARSTMEALAARGLVVVTRTRHPRSKWGSVSGAASTYTETVAKATGGQR